MNKSVGLIAVEDNNTRSEEHTSELQSRPHLVCCLLLEKKNVMTLTEKYRQQIDSELERLVRDRRPEGLYAPVSYVVSLGGKRIRPVLCLLGCARFNAERVKDSLYPALGLDFYYNVTHLHVHSFPTRRSSD